MPDRAPPGPPTLSWVFLMDLWVPYNLLTCCSLRTGPLAKQAGVSLWVCAWEVTSAMALAKLPYFCSPWVLTLKVLGNESPDGPWM